MSVNVKSVNPLIKIYEECPRSYFLTGNASFGKTTLLQHFAKQLHGLEMNNPDGTTQTLIVIYLSMYDVNLLSTYNVEKGPIIELLCSKGLFDRTIDRSGVFEMIADDISYRYVFLLDGINEIQDRHLDNGNSIYKRLEQEIHELFEFINVDVIASARSERVFVNSLFDKEGNDERLFKSIKLIGMCLDDGTMNPPVDKRKVAQYLGVGENSISEDLCELFQSPMLLSYYKQILESLKPGEKLEDINCKTELLDCYYKLDITRGKDEISVNDWDNVRREHILKWILPCVAFYVEGKMISADISGEAYDIDLKRIFDDACNQIEEYDTDMPRNKENLWNGLMRLQICDESGRFIHDIIREYWACKGLFLRLYYLKKNAANRSFIDSLARNIKRGTNRFEIVRQTKHIGLIEIIYELTKRKSIDNYEFLCRQYSRARKGSNDAEDVDYRAVFELFFHYMSMLDDLEEGKKAAEIGWFAYDGLTDDNRKSVFDLYFKEGNPYQLAYILNDMGYSTNNSHSIKSHEPQNKEGNPDTLTLLQMSRGILDDLLEKEIHEGDNNIIFRCKIMIGKNINNIGAYYYGCKQYKEALVYHKKALEYRKKLVKEALIASEKKHEAEDQTKDNIDDYIAELRNSMVASYRVISSDYYSLGKICIKNHETKEGYSNFQMAYSNFQKYLGYINSGKNLKLQDYNKMRFSEMDSEKYKDIQRIQVINALGTQIEMIDLLKSRQINSDKDELKLLLLDIEAELKYFNGLIETNSRRLMSSTINKLNDKKCAILKLLDNMRTVDIYDTSLIKKLCEV